MRYMKLEYVRSFVGVVNYKSFSLAAKYLFLSQPTISTHIRQLEEELGVTLLVRSTKNVQLSDKGKVFYPYALQLLETENQVMKQLKRGDWNSARTVTMAVSSVPGYYFLPQFLQYFNKKHQDVNFKIQEGDSGDVLQKLLEYDVEIGIGGLDSGNSKISAEVLFEDEIVLVTPNKPKYRNLNGVFPMEMLGKEQFIVREEGSGTRVVSRNLEEDLHIDTAGLHVGAQAESSELMRRAVENGVGVAFISRTAARESLEKQKVLQFDFPDRNTKRNIYLMYRKEYAEGSALEKVLEELRKFFRECSENQMIG